MWPSSVLGSSLLWAAGPETLAQSSIEPQRSHTRSSDARYALFPGTVSWLWPIFRDGHDQVRSFGTRNQHRPPDMTRREALGHVSAQDPNVTFTLCEPEPRFRTPKPGQSMHRTVPGDGTPPVCVSYLCKSN